MLLNFLFLLYAMFCYETTFVTSLSEVTIIVIAIEWFFSEKHSAKYYMWKYLHTPLHIISSWLILKRSFCEKTEIQENMKLINFPKFTQIASSRVSFQTLSPNSKFLTALLYDTCTSNYRLWTNVRTLFLKSFLTCIGKEDNFLLYIFLTHISMVVPCDFILCKYLHSLLV
jgi:hypothetical protein